MLLTRQAARFANGWHRDQVQEAGEQAAEPLAAAVQPFARRPDRRAPGRRPPARARHHHALRHGPAARRRASASTTSSPPATARRDGPLRRHHRRRVRVGPGQAAGRPGLGRRERRRPRRELGLLRHVLRPPAARRRRPPGRREPRPPAARPGRRPPLAGACTSTSPPGVPKLPCSASSPSRSIQRVVRPELFPWARFDIEGVEHIPEAGPAIVVANHRSYFDPLALGHRVRPPGPRRAVPRQEGGVRRPGRRPARPGHGRHPGRPGHRLRRAADGGGRRPGSGELVAIMPQGTIPRGRAFFDPELKGRWGAARLAAHDRGAGHPDRPVGHRGGVAPVRAPAPGVERRAPADRPGAGRRAGRAGRRLGRRRHQADHGGHRRPAPARGPGAREPTAEELARTYPPGHAGDDAGEADRRPGED